MRQAFFGGAAEVMSHPARDITDPGAGHFGDAAGADQHIGRDIGNRRDHVQFAAALADQFVGRGKWHRVLQRSAEHDIAAILNEGRNGFRQAHEFVVINGSNSRRELVLLPLILRQGRKNN